MRNRLRICIIGCGSWAACYSRLLGNFLNKVDLYFCSRDIQKAKAYSDRFKGKGYFNGISEVAKDNGIDAFMIFTPHNVHLQNVRSLPNNGRYILLQKPIAGSLDEAKEIASLCNKEKLMIAENFRFMPAVIEAKRILDSNILGKPISVNMQEASTYVPNGWRTKIDQMGGGILIDSGIHYLSTLRYLFGEPLEVVALLPEVQFSRMEGESAISLTVKMNTGVTCNMNLAWAAAADIKTEPSINIICEKGSVEIKLQSRFLNLQRGKKKKRIFLGFNDVSGHKSLLREFIHKAENKLPIVLNYKIGIDDLSFVKIAYKSLQDKKAISAREFYLQNELSIPK